MLRAITGYFFGGVVEEAPQTVVECDTREVNDWLVVNMADRPNDDIDMEDEIGVNLMTDSEYDEVLDAVSCLMRTEELEDDESFLDENCSETEEIDSQTWSKSDENSSDESDDDRMSVSSDSDSPQFDAERGVLRRFESFGNFEPFLYFNLLPLKFDISREVVQNFRLDDRTFFLASSKPGIVVAKQNSNIKYPSGTDGLHDYKKAVKVVRQSDFLAVPETQMTTQDQYEDKVFKFPKINNICKQVIEMVKENRHLKTRCPEVTCHPVYSKSYVNHRNPALPHKSDVMQKIKQLEVEQAQDNKIKRFISKGQLNRQNKNYIFDASCKKNRRKNLQRNPSGANNNRKC